MGNHTRADQGPSQRQLRVAEQVRHIVVETLQRGRFDDPLLFDAVHNVTITEVRISPDLRHATAYIFTLGGTNLDEIIQALNGAASVFQKEIAKNTRMKFTPRMHFRLDDSFENSEKIDKILRELPPKAVDLSDEDSSYEE